MKDFTIIDKTPIEYKTKKKIFDIKCREMIFKSNYNEKLSNEIIDAMRTVSKVFFGCDFNQKISKLPKNVKTLKLWSSYKQPLDNLPHSLRKLKIKGNFSSGFNLPLNNLPIGLEELHLPISYNQTLTNLPITMKKIVLPKNYTCDIPLIETIFYYKFIFFFRK